MAVKNAVIERASQATLTEAIEARGEGAAALLLALTTRFLQPFFSLFFEKLLTIVQTSNKMYL